MVCRAVPAALGAVASVSCAQIAGIDNTSGSARPFDSLAVTRKSIGATLADVPLDLTGLAATYFPAKPGTSDFDRVPAEADATAGTWTTQLREPAAVQFTLPEPTAPLLFAFPSHQLKVLYAPLEHPGRVPAADAATFTVTAPLDAAITVNDSFQTYVVGAWLQRTFSPTEVPVGAATIAAKYGFTAANSVASRAQPDKVTAQDAFLILRYDTLSVLTGVAASKMGVDQTDGDTVVAMDTMVPVTADQMLDVKVSSGTLAMRYSLVRPAVTGLSMSWSLVAAPGYKLASNAGPKLASASMVSGEGFSAKYGNPFAARGWNTILTLATSSSRVYMAPVTMAPISLFAGMNQFVEPSPMMTLNLPAGLPLLIKVDGVLLSTDDQPIKPPSQFVRVTFETDTPGGIGAPSATLYQLEVWDLVPSMPPANTLERQLVFSAASDAASFALPPEVFQMGHRYTLRAVATLGGYPSLRDGDFVTRSLPLAQSFLDSTVIAVVP